MLEGSISKVMFKCKEPYVITDETCCKEFPLRKPYFVFQEAIQFNKNINIKMYLELRKERYVMPIGPSISQCLLFIQNIKRAKWGFEIEKCFCISPWSIYRVTSSQFYKDLCILICDENTVKYGMLMKRNDKRYHKGQQPPSNV